MSPSKTRVTIALERYDRHIPFFMQALDVPAELELVPLEVGMDPPRRDGIDRHRRMLRDGEFDVAEVSLASYIIAKSRGAPFTAIPVFPRRLFSQNHIFVGPKSNIDRPSDLVGKRVIAWAFQVTMSVLAKSDLKNDYNAPWEKMQWLTLYDEEIPLNDPSLPIRRLPNGSNPVDMLLAGEADAFIHPHPPQAILSKSSEIRRLFPDPAAECLAYFKRNGFFPIMHLIAIKDEVAAKLPDLPRQLMRLWDQSKAQAHDFYKDPGYSVVALGRYAYEDQMERCGEDIWPSGVAANRKDLERFLDAMVDQKLTPRRVAVEELFAPSVLDS